MLFLLVPLLWGAPGSTSGSAADWVAPLPEPLTVTKAFDPPETPYGSGHRGVDLAASPGQAIRAAGPGTVVYAGPLAGRGVVSLQHADGLRTTYEPVQASLASGVQVGLGQVIGTVQAGHAGCPAAACLHWGLKRAEVYLDPLLLLRQGPVRLLPRYGGAGSISALDPALLLPASTTLNALWLGSGLLPLTPRPQSSRPVLIPPDPSGQLRTERRTCATHKRCKTQRARSGRLRRAGAPADRPP
ncbi:MAG: M23 family metallopeptidase [Actinomycetota bacterium]|nr:M23 family metallopeptidase [Actinomycetota bacterium]